MNQKLVELLSFARQNVPFYKARLADWDPNEISSFTRVPILNKKDIVGNEASLFPGNINEKTLVTEFTSGTSGVPLRCYKSKDERIRLGRRLWQLRKEYGEVFPTDRKVTFSSFIRVNNVPVAEEIMFEGNTLHLSLHNLSVKAMERYFQAICDFQPSWMFSVPSALFFLASYMLDHGLSNKKTGIKYIETTGEMLFDYQKEIIQKAFNCPVHNHYGAREFWLLAMSCPDGHLHVEDNDVYVEAVPSDSDPEVTELVVTTLQNREWPLIRYKVADRIEIKNQTCSCGFVGQVITTLYGRTTDMIHIGNWVGNPILFFYAVVSVNEMYKDAVRQFQIVQNKENNFEFYYTKGRGFSNEALSKLHTEITNQLPTNASISYLATDTILIGSAAKQTYFIPFPKYKSNK